MAPKTPEDRVDALFDMNEFPTYAEVVGIVIDAEFDTLTHPEVVAERHGQRGDGKVTPSERHEIARKTGSHYHRLVTWAECLCGWQSRKVYNGWAFLDQHLRDEEYRHLANVGVIKK